MAAQMNSVHRHYFVLNKMKRNVVYKVQESIVTNEFFESSSPSLGSSDSMLRTIWSESEPLQKTLNMNIGHKMSSVKNRKEIDVFCVGDSETINRNFR